MQYQFKVRHQRPKEEGKDDEVSRMHVAKIYDELKRGKAILEISRLGSGKDTRYFVKAVR